VGSVNCSPFAIYSLYNAPVSDEARNRNVILLATAILVAPRLRELRDSPALRSAIADAVRVAKNFARGVDATLRSDGVLRALDSRESQNQGKVKP